MIKILKDIYEYIDFINKINKTDNYSDPMLSNEVQIKNNLLESVNKKDNKVVGYVDITHKYEENEPFDVFFKEEYRNNGIATDMLSPLMEKLLLVIEVV